MNTFLGPFTKFPKVTTSVVMSLRNSAPHGRVSIKSNIWLFFKNLSRNFKFHYNRTRINGTSHEAQYTFSIKSRSVLRTMQNVLDKICRESRYTHCVLNIFFSSKILPLWDNVKKYCRRGRPQTTIWRMRIGCWRPKATNTHSECVILIALQLQKWLHKRFSILSDTYCWL